MPRHKFQGRPERFPVLAEFIEEHYGNTVKHIADVGGGQGMLAKLLNKKNYRAEVIDPRGYTLKGLLARKENYDPDSASYYDLIVGLHPDEALKEVVRSALVRPVIVIPCCNFWDENRKLGRDALLQEIENYYKEHLVTYEKITFEFEGPKNIGLVSEPPAGTGPETGQPRSADGTI